MRGVNKKKQQQQQQQKNKLTNNTTGSPGEKCDGWPVLWIYQESTILLNLQIIKVYMGALPVVKITPNF